MSSDNVKCANHPDVGYDSAFHVPGVRVTFLCAPCAVTYRSAVYTEFKSKREAWESREDHWYVAGKDNEGRPIILEKR